MQFTKRILVIIALFISSLAGFAQDAHFTQFYANPLYLNPAFTGSQICPRFVMNYRNQWPGINHAYNTITASLDKHYDDLQGGLGIQFLNDYEADGAISNLRAAISYAYKLELNHKFSLRAGFEAAFDQKSFNPNKVTFEDQIDPRFGFIDINGNTNPTAEDFAGNTSKSKLDLSAGILFYSENFFGGFAAHHLTEPDEGLDKVSILPRKLTIHMGTIFHPS